MRFPPAGWTEKISPLASTNAKVGGEMRYYAGPYPQSLNFYIEYSTGGELIFNNLFENLLTLNPLTLEFEPWIAKSWTVSEDLRTFTFELDPNARWSDGAPLTAHDIAWTFDAIMKPENLTGPWKVPLERFDKPEVLDDHTIRFHARETHWRNLLTLSGLYILPKHVMATQDFNDINFELPVVSGPYRQGELREGFFCKLERRADWWRIGYPAARGLGNLQTIRLVYFQGDETSFDEMKKGKLDFFMVGMARRWVNEVNGEKFQKNWIVKQRVENRNPIGFSGFAMNLRKPIFADVRTRKALAHLLDRETLNHTLMYDQYIMHKSYWEDLYDNSHPCTNASYAFTKDRARALLAEAGWRPNPNTGVLEKDGRPFSFSFLNRDASQNKYVAKFQQDLHDVGIDMKLTVKDWSAWMKAMDQYDFDMTWCNYSGSLWKDPEGMWASKEADRPAGQNYTGFKNPRVDELIDLQRGEFDVHKRATIMRELDGILTEQVPYVLLWYLNYTRIIYWNKYGTPDHVLGSISDERGALQYWWYDEDDAANLREARASGLALPKRPYAVRFEDVFKQQGGASR